jgi:hypothetical protein
MTLLLCLIFFLQTPKIFSQEPNLTNQFSLDIFNPFLPGKTLQKDNNYLPLFKKSGYTLGLVYIKHQSYQFPLFIQENEGKILDIFARLPSYFLSDFIHKELIKRLGKQDFYTKKDNSALYQWNREGLEYYYSASCTLTCFPDFYSILSVSYPEDFAPLIRQLELNLQN